MPQRRPAVRAALLAAAPARPCSTRFPLLTLALLVCFWLPSTAEAIRPRGTTMTGVIQSVDHVSRWIVFAQDGGPVRRFVYTAWTKLWHDESEALPSHLKAGMRVRVELHNPLFGPDYVTRIELLEQAGDAGGKKRK
jgi:hypothetical protein